MRSALSAGAVFGAAFLVFVAEPLVAKMLLPIFGGSAATWTVCLLFFQAMVLAGYSAVFAGERWLRGARAMVVPLVLLAIALVSLPLRSPDGSFGSAEGHPEWHLLALLIGVCALPFLALLTVTPYLEARQGGGRLVAISNLGSFAGLLSFPVFEILFTSRQIAMAWSALFAVVATVYAAAIWSSRGMSAPEPVSGGRWRLGWWAWPALGALLLTSSTAMMCTWMPVVPFLWIAPLAVYLLSFVLAFGVPGVYRREVFVAGFACLALVAVFLERPETPSLLAEQLAAMTALVLMGAWICHAEAVNAAGDAQGSPSFLLALAFGGVVGGGFASFAAPHLFPGLWEFPLVFALIGLALWAMRPRFRYLLLAAIWVSPALWIYHEVRDGENRIWRTRNFYGVVEVLDEVQDGYHLLSLVQTGYVQGLELRPPFASPRPACDYDSGSGIALAMRFASARRHHEPIRAASIGMGIGMIASMAGPGDDISFYELNPAVAEAASTNFDFMRGSPAHTSVILGDGRLGLERRQGPPLDVLVLDAFHSGSPPMHLLTREAFASYLKQLKPNGILAVDSDVLNFDLSPLHRGLAAEFGLPVAWFKPREHRGSCARGMNWALYTRDRQFWEEPEVKDRISRWPDHSDRKILWTDGKSGLLDVMRSPLEGRHRHRVAPENSHEPFEVEEPD